MHLLSLSSRILQTHKTLIVFLSVHKPLKNNIINFTFTLAEFRNGSHKRNGGQVFSTPVRSQTLAQSTKYSVPIDCITYLLICYCSSVPNSVESRPHFRQTVRDAKRPRPSGVAMLAASAASGHTQATPFGNPWFRAKPIYLGTYDPFLPYEERI